MRTDQAKAIPLDALLAALGCQPVQRKKGELYYRSPFRPAESEASFIVTADRRAWYDHGRGRGGNILDLVMELYGVSVSGALRQLDMLMSGTLPSVQVQLRTEQEWQQQKSTVRVQQVQELHSEALKTYLETRGIPVTVGQQWLKEIRFTLEDARFAEKEFYALGFANQSGGWEIRNRYYQGCTGKDITIIPAAADSNPTDMAVFEGFMDFLSAVVYTGRPPTIRCVVLNSASMRQQALAAIRHYRPDTVHLYLDNDKTGRELAEYFRDELVPEGIEVDDKSSLYRNYKDFNELLVAKSAVQENEVKRLIINNTFATSVLE